MEVILVDEKVDHVVNPHQYIKEDFPLRINQWMMKMNKLCQKHASKTPNHWFSFVTARIQFLRKMLCFDFRILFDIEPETNKLVTANHGKNGLLELSKNLPKEAVHFAPLTMEFGHRIIRRKTIVFTFLFKLTRSGKKSQRDLLKLQCTQGVKERFPVSHSLFSVVVSNYGTVFAFWNA